MYAERYQTDNGWELLVWESEDVYLADVDGEQIDYRFSLCQWCVDNLPGCGEVGDCCCKECAKEGGLSL